MLKHLYALYKLPSEVRFVVRGATDIVRRKADPRLRFVATDVLPRHKHSGRQLDMILTYRTNDQLLRVFAKGRRARFYTSLEQHLYEHGLDVPRLLGSIRRAELHIAVWEYVGGRPPSFHPSAVEHCHAIIRAVAKASLHHLPLAIHKTLAPRTLWLDQVHHELNSYVDQLRHFPQVLCHHDIKRENLILTGDGRCFIVDWDSASMGAAGSSLRLFALFEDAELRSSLFSLYANLMRMHEVDVLPKDVEFAATVNQALWDIHTGLPSHVLRGRLLLERAAQLRGK